ncbi:MAG: shikimate kinase [Bacteroidota bacterium]
MKQPIFLIGFMASGKTTIGSQLAEFLKCPFLDTDRIIEEKKGVTVAQLFAEQGERYFRDLEKRVVEGLDPNALTVVAVGGGLPCYNGLIDVLNSKGITVYLKTDPSVLLKRLIHALEERPLIEGMGEEELKKFISDKMEEREPFYKKAQYTVDANNDTLKAIIQQLLLHRKIR